MVVAERRGGERGKKKRSKREPGVTSMADARSRGNISLTDVDKHCGRASKDPTSMDREPRH